MQPVDGILPVQFLATVLLGLDDDHAAIGDTLVIQCQKPFFDDFREGDDARISKRKCTALDTLLTFCPPEPWARIALISISPEGMSKLG